MQPSPANAYVWWSMSVCESVLKRAASIVSAMASPTALANPCPSGPVVVSTPGVSPTSGCPGVNEPSAAATHLPPLVLFGALGFALVSLLLLERALRR